MQIKKGSLNCSLANAEIPHNVNEAEKFANLAISTVYEHMSILATLRALGIRFPDALFYLCHIHQIFLEHIVNAHRSLKRTLHS